MSAKENAPTGAATSAGAKMEAETGQTTTSTKNDTTPAADNQPFRVASLLLHGAENGVTLPNLESMTGWDGRTVRRQIERERRAGALIINNNQHGYFLTDDPAEAQRFAHSMLHRSREIARTARAVERAAGLL